MSRSSLQAWRESPRSRVPLALNHTLLFVCTAMYFGTGWSLVLFNFVVAGQLTVDNYYLQFVPQVTAATAFFTGMTLVMLATAAVMTWAEWRTRYRWVPVVVLLGVVAATALTMVFILPYNETMAAGITDPAELSETLASWMTLNRVRVGLWTVQFGAMLFYFASRAFRADP